MPAQYVKPYVKTNKNDYIDAEAIAEPVTRPTMRNPGGRGLPTYPSHVSVPCKFKLAER